MTAASVASSAPPLPGSPRVGVTMAAMRHPQTGALHYIRNDNMQPRGVLALGPPGAGKSVSCFIPTLLTFPESAFIYDPKFELFYTTAGARRDVLGNEVLLFAPTLTDGSSCHMKLTDSIRFKSPREIADLQNFVKIFLDPADKAAEGAEAHWIATGATLLECVLLHLEYTDSDQCTLEGCYNFITDPTFEEGLDSALKLMMRAHHNYEDPVTGEFYRTHPYIAHSAKEIANKAPNEKSGVSSVTTRFLQPFRDPLLAEATSRSDVTFDQLMNHERPVSLYFCIPSSDVLRLRAVVRLVLNLLVRAHTGDEALRYVNNEPVYQHKHRILLAIDEFVQLQKQEYFKMQLSIMRSYGLLPLLGVQDLDQLRDVYGNFQPITKMLAYKIFFRPNDVDAAEWPSNQLGNGTAANYQRSYSGKRFGIQSNISTTVSHTQRKLRLPEELVEESDEFVHLRISGLKPVKAIRPYYKDDPELRRRSLIPPPERSARLIDHGNEYAPPRAVVGGDTLAARVAGAAEALQTGEAVYKGDDDGARAVAELHAREMREQEAAAQARADADDAAAEAARATTAKATNGAASQSRDVTTELTTETSVEVNGIAGRAAGGAEIDVAATVPKPITHEPIAHEPLDAGEMDLSDVPDISMEDF